MVPDYDWHRDRRAEFERTRGILEYELAKESRQVIVQHLDHGPALDRWADDGGPQP